MTEAQGQRRTPDLGGGRGKGAFPGGMLAETRLSVRGGDEQLSTSSLPSRLRDMTVPRGDVLGTGSRGSRGGPRALGTSSVARSTEGQRGRKTTF